MGLPEKGGEGLAMEKVPEDCVGEALEACIRRRWPRHLRPCMVIGLSGSEPTTMCCSNP